MCAGLLTSAREAVRVHERDSLLLCLRCGARLHLGQVLRVRLLERGGGLAVWQDRFA